MNKFKKILSLTLILVLLASNLFVPVRALAQEAPTPPEAPTAPTAPEAPTPPSAPEAPTPPTAPTPPEAPTAPTPPTPENQVKTDAVSTGGGSSASGNTNGDSTIATGDATNDSNLATVGNTNDPQGGCCGGGSASINSGNGSGSNNSASTNTTDSANTTQGNSASVGNNLTSATVTGQNGASLNTGGDSSIKTGDANTSGTVITAVNTNVDGVAVATFNVDGNYTGDIVLAPGNASSSCQNGCGAQNQAQNSGNGSNSNNTAANNSSDTTNVDQTNNAQVGSNLNLASDSGDNTSSLNTNGDSTISSGDANVSANVLTMANNNVEGNILYNVVNIFGDLVGDIILPQSTIDALLCGCGSSTAKNTGNGAGSNNTAKNNSSNTDNTKQANTANIDNELTFSATTGDNESSFNTDGNSTVQTGDASVDANVINVANSNIDGGTWWLVIVNKGGKWIGKILGAPDGATMAGSDGTEFEVDPVTGEVTAVNSDNGAGSTNDAENNSSSTTNVNQTNNADIKNNINLSANSGGNKSSYNTGGSSNIKTGDAKIIANLVNFVNNNITGGGKLVVTVVNVFGSWMGDFVTPGQTKQNHTNNTAGNPQMGGGSSNNNSNSNSNSGLNTTTTTVGTTTVTTSPAGTTVTTGGSVSGVSVTNSGQTNLFAGANNTSGQVAGAQAGAKTFVLNIAWALVLLPLAVIFYFERKYAFLRNAASKVKVLLLL